MMVTLRDPRQVLNLGGLVRSFATTIVCDSAEPLLTDAPVSDGGKRRRVISLSCSRDCDTPSLSRPTLRTPTAPSWPFRCW